MGRVNVYVVTTGEYAEGDTPVAAFGSLKAARIFCGVTFDVSPVRRRADVWMAHRNATDQVWIRRFPLGSAS